LRPYLGVFEHMIIDADKAVLLFHTEALSLKRV
jgi:hypothetical protein